MRAGLLIALFALAPFVAPDTPWTCPASHPIKGYVLNDSRRVYFPPDNRFYAEASPDRCYATEEQPGGGDSARL